MNSDDHPEVVRETVAQLGELGLWFVTSRNPCVKSCADAADRRQRLGYQGIPLCDELKSSFETGIDPRSDSRVYVALHCRGHEQLDYAKVRAVLGFETRRIDPSELEAEFGQGYGLVNPFLISRRADVRQIFDTQVTRSYFPPHTMMTNLGHCEFGVEFDPVDLVARLPRSEVADIAVSNGFREPKEHVIGILTGNSPESGIMLWELINTRVRERSSRVSQGDLSFPRVVVESMPEMGLSMDLAARESSVRDVVLAGVGRLCSAGATLVGIACNTTQYFSEDVRRACSAHGAEFVSLVDETARVLREANVTSFSLLAVGPAADLSHYSDFGRLREAFDIRVPDAGGTDRIEKLAFKIKADPTSDSTMSSFRNVVKGVAELDTVLLALTELSVVNALQKKQRSTRTYFDTLQILAEAMADRYLAERLALETRERNARE